MRGGGQPGDPGPHGIVQNVGSFNNQSGLPVKVGEKLLFTWKQIHKGKYRFPFEYTDSEALYDQLRSNYSSVTRSPCVIEE